MATLVFRESRAVNGNAPFDVAAPMVSKEAYEADRERYRYISTVPLSRKEASREDVEMKVEPHAPMLSLQ